MIATPRQNNELDVLSLEWLIQEYFVRDLSKPTYASAKRSYLLFCQQINMPPLPIIERSTFISLSQSQATCQL